MKFSYSASFGGSITLQFECSKCNRVIVEEKMPVPDPPTGVDKSEDDYSEAIEELNCSMCSHKNPIIIRNSINGCIVDLPESNESTHVQIDFDYDDAGYLASLFDEFEQAESPFSIFKEELSNIKTILESKDYSEKIAKMVYKQLYSSVITIMEAYLLETIVKLLFNHEKYLKKFLKTYRDFEEIKIPLSKVMDTDVKNEVRKVLAGIMYHNIAKVSILYDCAFGIKFENISGLSRAVSARHDLVHRNGKTNDGEKVEVGRWEVNNLINVVNRFITKIEDQIAVIIEQEDTFYNGIDS